MLSYILHHLCSARDVIQFILRIDCRIITIIRNHVRSKRSNDDGILICSKQFLHCFDAIYALFTPADQTIYMFSTVKIQNILHFLALFVKNHKIHVGAQKVVHIFDESNVISFRHIFIYKAKICNSHLSCSQIVPAFAGAISSTQLIRPLLFRVVSR